MNRKILALALPNIISNITVPLLGLVDIAIVGHLGDDSLIGGIAIGTAVFNFIYWNFAFLRMGASGCTAQAYGARNFTEIASVFVRALILALAAALLLVVFQRPIGHAVFLLMDGTPHTMSYAADYFMPGSGRLLQRSRCLPFTAGTSVCRIRASRCTFRSGSMSSI